MCKLVYLSCFLSITCFLSACGATVASVGNARDDKVEAQPQRLASMDMKAKLSPMLAALLRRASADMAAKRLLLPENDNAVDKYRAVLMLDSSNVQALAGLEQVVALYDALILKHIRAGRLTVANRLIRRVDRHFSGNPAIKKWRVALQAATDKANVVDLSRVESLDALSFELPKSALSRKSAGIKVLLEALAKRVSETGESVIIKARSDAEGRWIYRVMKKAVSGYRIRGDIHRSSSPEIILEAPLG